VTKFSQEDGIEDDLTDIIGQIAMEIRACQIKNQEYIDLRNQLYKAIKAKKYLVFTANVTNYGTWCIGESKLLFVPQDRRGALSIFRNKTIRLICIGSGRFTRLLAAAAVKLESKSSEKVIEKFKSNQAYLG